MQPHAFGFSTAKELQNHASSSINPNHPLCSRYGPCRALLPGLLGLKVIYPQDLTDDSQAMWVELDAGVFP
jgi:hypothetical protein